jgi:hypothetical protein
MAKRKLEQSDDWYPIHRGPFLFAPHFLTVSEWFLEFNRVVRISLLDTKAMASIDKPRSGRQMLIKFPKSEMMIDGDGGMFFVDQLGQSEAEDDDGFWNYWSGPGGTPTQFFEELRDPANVRKIGTDYESIFRFSELLYLRMTKRFEKALKSGFAKLTAYIGTPFGERTLLEPWQLKHIKLVGRERERYFEDDHDLDEGISQDGKKIFGLGVTPIIRPVSASFAAPEVVGRPRGRRRSIDREQLQNLMLDLVRKKGIPSAKTPKWTRELLVKAVMSQMQVGRTTVFENIPSVIEKFKEERGRKGLR